ncbi:MAG: type II toxin-antitoxin system RelE/ParE family toxin [Alphaproteobacteria bacterium]|nr:type II toxin-antitoxin system RelE/ParE family toxin [Alphaproteobacteria bacterium]
MIKSFACRHTEALFLRRPTKRFGPALQKAGLRKLLQIDAATRLETLNVPPANRLEVLRGKRKGQHSILINDQFRICFRWEAGNSTAVEIVDYH